MVDATETGTVDGGAGGAASAGQPMKPPASSSTIVQGQRVEARWRGRESWFDATVVAVRARGTFDILYDDGDREQAVHPTYVRASEKHSSSAAAAATGTSSEDAATAGARGAKTGKHSQLTVQATDSGHRSNAAPKASPTHSAKALRALRDAKMMQDEGLISDEDFDAMKKRILSALN
jgi:hypothetical protein